MYNKLIKGIRYVDLVQSQVGLGTSFFVGLSDKMVVWTSK